MKMAIALAAAAALSSTALFADDANAAAQAADSAEQESYVSPITGQPYNPKSKRSFAEFKERDERLMKKAGGFIYFDEVGPKALLVETRDRKALVMEQVADLYKKGSKLTANVLARKRGDKCPVELGRELMADTNNLFVIEIVDGCEKLPALTVFPEERIGIVNADRLKGGTDDPSVPEFRVAKEVWRAIGFITGIGFSQAENDMMQPYYTLKELDGLDNAYIQPMNMVKMQKFWKRFGVERPRKVPYRAAVKQGWAPAPTNDLQKAVWEEVKAAATNAPASK